MDLLRKIKQKEIGFYDLKPGQTVASIGAQCCHWEAAYASMTDSVNFYLEDIDTSNSNNQSGCCMEYYGKLRGPPMTSTYQLIPGDERSTKLPENAFDKILIINSFHEFTCKLKCSKTSERNLNPADCFLLMKHYQSDTANSMESAIYQC
jgi:hypothetical protein